MPKMCVNARNLHSSIFISCSDKIVVFVFSHVDIELLLFNF